MAKKMVMIDWLNKPVHRSISYKGAVLVYGELLVVIISLIAIAALHLLAASILSADYRLVLVISFALYGFLVAVDLVADIAIALWRLSLREKNSE